MSMQITLSNTPASEKWGKKAILSANENGMTIHLNEKPESEAFITIQQAARKIKNQGILAVTLAGKGWDLEQCWAFHQGYVSVKNAGTVQYPNLGEAQTEFDARLECTTFTRTIINKPSDQLTPVQLAEQAVEFVTQQAVKKGLSSAISVEIISGEDLKKQGYDAYGVVLDEKNQVSAFVDNDYDLAYLVLHGGNGENGKIQAVLDILGKKYTGSGVLASAITMDKNKTKQIAQSVGIKTPKSYRTVEEIERFPVIIKPVDEGSSKGLFLCNNKEEAQEAVKKLAKPIIEDYIVGEELTVGVLNGEALGVLKIIPQADVLYDYDSKYAKGGSIHEFPAKIENKSYKEAMKIAEKIHSEFGMKGISRSDFILSEGKLYFLEVNSSPGMTKTSLIPDLATLKGYTFDDVVRITVETFLK